jgi:hypothetical protein
MLLNHCHLCYHWRNLIPMASFTLVQFQFRTCNREKHEMLSETKEGVLFIIQEAHSPFTHL